MTNDTIRCVSLTNGALSPDQRVNYEFGLVLGVNEFRQEQGYLLDKNYLHNRALHGYGTVYGLHVTAARPAANTSEVLITVDKGMGIDQYGRGFLLREAQCAYLGAWLARQEQAAPGTIQKHAEQDPSGILHIYVVAQYDECMDALVPIPGQPCSSSDVTQAPSRIRDAFRMELRWDPPEMPAWVAIQRFARLMAGVRIVTGLPPAQSDEDIITQFVRTLDQPGPFDVPGDGFGIGSPPQPYLRLPADTAHEALDRIFTVWVTEVRPRLAPDLSDPATPLLGQVPEPAILLARIDFVVDTPFDAGHPAVDAFNPPDDTGRPFLLHTGLIQELLALGNGGETAQRGEHEFATVEALGAHTLLAWVHHPTPLALDAPVPAPLQPLTLVANGQPATITSINAVPGFDNVFQIGVQAPLPPGTRLEAHFHSPAIRLGGGGFLSDELSAADYAYVGQTADEIVVYAVVSALQAAQTFVTIDALPAQGGQGLSRLSLWFHTDQPVILPGQLNVQRGIGGPATPFVAQPGAGTAAPSFLWELSAPNAPALADNELLSITFDTDQVGVGSGAATLTSVIQDRGVNYIGYDGGHTIQAYYEVDISAVAATGPTIDEIIKRVMQIPAAPFVTIAPPAQVNPETLRFEMWFHVDQTPERDEVRVAALKPNADVRVFGEVEGSPTPEPLNIASIVPMPSRPPLPTLPAPPPQHNVFILQLDGAIWAKNQPHFLRFAFDLGLPVTAGGGQLRLGDWIDKSGIKFDGFMGKNIVAYVRLPG